MSIPCILIPAIVGIICALLGYLIGKSGKKDFSEEVNSLQDDLNNYKRMNSQLRGDLEKLRLQINDQKSNDNINPFITQPRENIGPVIFDPSFAKAVFGKKIHENDLKIIEGIGPKIEELFKTSGIQSWKLLSETSVDRCKEILIKAGERFQFHDPGTWPRQAKLAYEGKWQELKDWQSSLEGGREK